jgi:hypothetical protein
LRAADDGKSAKSFLGGADAGITFESTTIAMIRGSALKGMEPCYFEPVEKTGPG